MRLSDAGLRCRTTKLIYPDHRIPPWPTEGATPRSLQRWLGLQERLRVLPGLEYFPEHPAQRGFVHWRGTRSLT
jgi:hypothetical protein